MSGVKSTVVGWARSLLVNAFLASFEPQEIAGKLRAIVGMKALDPPIISAERNRMWDVVDRAEPCLPAKSLARVSADGECRPPVDGRHRGRPANEHRRPGRPRG